MLVAATAGARGRVIVVVAGGGADSFGSIGRSGGESGLPTGGASVDGLTGAVVNLGAFAGGTFAGGRAFCCGGVLVVVVVVVGVAVGSTGRVAEAAAAVASTSGAARFRELPP